MGGALQSGGGTQFLALLPTAEDNLSSRDSKIGAVIAAQEARWPRQPTEDPIWGLIRVVMAQQVSTSVACRLAERVKSAHPELLIASSTTVPDLVNLRSFGLPQKRAECCSNIVRQSEQILSRVHQGQSWEQALTGIKGIGPWTVSVFRIMVLREPDVLPLGDIGRERAIKNVYGRPRNVERLGENWRPFRSVACWYLWRTLGNEQLG